MALPKRTFLLPRRDFSLKAELTRLLKSSMDLFDGLLPLAEKEILL
jgi:hypothetical protein